MQQTKTTMHLRLPARPRWLDQIPAPLLASMLILGIAAGISTINHRAPTVAPAPTPALPLIIIQKEPAAAPAQQVVYQPAPAPARMVVAFGGPDMATVLGPIPAPALGEITGRWGDEWVSTMHDGATVWIRVSELGASLVNLAPAAPQLQPAYQQAPAPAYVPQPSYQVDNAPQAPEPPAEQPAAAPVVAAPVPQAQPTEPPSAGALFQQDAVQIALQKEAWRQEHCFGSGAAEVCH